MPAEKVVVSYPSKSITNFPILETAKQKGFFRRSAECQRRLHARRDRHRSLADRRRRLRHREHHRGDRVCRRRSAARDHEPQCLCRSRALRQPKYRSLAQLKGAVDRILNPGGLVDTLLRRILIQGGLQRARCRHSQHGWHAGALCRLEVWHDCSVNAERSSQPARGEGFTKLAATRDYVNVSGTGLVVHTDQIKKRPAMTKRFMRATLRAMNYIRENRTETTQMIVREFGMDQEVATSPTNSC